MCEGGRLADQLFGFHTTRSARSRIDLQCETALHFYILYMKELEECEEPVRRHFRGRLHNLYNMNVCPSGADKYYLGSWWLNSRRKMFRV
jgi:hypothetical protein